MAILVKLVLNDADKLRAAARVVMLKARSASVTPGIVRPLGAYDTVLISPEVLLEPAGGLSAPPAIDFELITIVVVVPTIAAEPLPE